MKHAVVFVDHQEARIFFPDGTDVDAGHVKAKHQHHTGGHHELLDKEALESLCTKVKDAEEILLVGPGSAKNELSSWMAAHKKELHKRIVGVETVDHPTPGQLQSLARTAFKRIDAFR